MEATVEFTQEFWDSLIQHQPPKQEQIIERKYKKDDLYLEYGDIKENKEKEVPLESYQLNLQRINEQVDNLKSKLNEIEQQDQTFEQNKTDVVDQIRIKQINANLQKENPDLYKRCLNMRDQVYNCLKQKKSEEHCFKEVEDFYLCSFN